jgi:SPRY domain-containing SOCS box protein 3
MVGFGTSKTCLNYENYEYVNLIGNDKHSWGLNHCGFLCHDSKTKLYCEKFCEVETVVGVLMDFYSKSLSFYKNGIEMGVAFE